MDSPPQNSMKSEAPQKVADVTSARGDRFRYTVRGLFLALTCLTILFAFGHYIKRASEKARWISSSHNFEFVGMALIDINDLYGSLPYPIRRDGGGDVPFPRTYDPNAAPLSSWRFALMEYMKHVPPSWRRDLPWDSVENRAIAAETHWWESFGYGETSDTIMFAITGPGTAFGDGKAELPRRLQEIDDDTILVVETRNSGVHWMEPSDFDIRTMPRTINAADGRGISSRYPFGFHVLFADGAVWALSHDTPFEELEKFFTIHGAGRHDRNEVLGAYRVH